MKMGCRHILPACMLMTSMGPPQCSPLLIPAQVIINTLKELFSRFCFILMEFMQEEGLFYHNVEQAPHFWGRR